MTAFVELAQVDLDDDAAQLAALLDHVEGLVSDEDVDALTAEIDGLIEGSIMRKG